MNTVASVDVSEPAVLPLGRKEDNEEPEVEAPEVEEPPGTSPFGHGT